MSKKTGYLVYYKEDAKYPELVPFEYESKYWEVGEKLAKELGLKEDTFDSCGAGRYVSVTNGHKYVECFTSEVYSYRKLEDYYYIFDTVKQRWTNELTWVNRDNFVENHEDAIELLSVQFLLNFDSMDEEKLSEMKEFAAKWNIPFSAELIGNFTNMFVSQFPSWNWDSSSAYC
jgi:hypothetical protein